MRKKPKQNSNECSQSASSISHPRPGYLLTRSKRSKTSYLFCVCICVCVFVWVAQLCPTLCDPMNCSPPGSFVHGDSPGKNTGVGCHVFLQGIFPTQGSNPGLLHCRQILYQWATREAQFSTWQPVYKNSNTWGKKSLPFIKHQAHSASGLCIVSSVQNVPQQLLGSLIPHQRLPSWPS